VTDINILLAQPVFCAICQNACLFFEG